MSRPASTDGDVVDLVADKGKFVARGIYNSRSQIRVRLYTWNVGEPLDETNWRGRIERAIELRRAIGYEPPASDKQSRGRESAARLVYSEADGLSGLIVDRFADWLAVQVTGLAMAQRLPQIVPLLVELTRARGHRDSHRKGRARRPKGSSCATGCTAAKLPDGPVFIDENGLRYGVDLAEGQKTGFYLDQRENRKRGGRLFSRSAGARHVLLQRRVQPECLGAAATARRSRASTPAPRPSRWPGPTPS